MKANQRTRRPASPARRTRALGLVGAMTLSAVMLFCVACTKEDMTGKETDSSTGTAAGTSAETTEKETMTDKETDSLLDPSDGTVEDTAEKPLDPDAGTVETETGTGKSRMFGPRFMH